LKLRLAIGIFDRTKLKEKVLMQREMLKSKIHRVTVTEAELYYEGSITVDKDYLRRQIFYLMRKFRY